MEDPRNGMTPEEYYGWDYTDPMSDRPTRWLQWVIPGEQPDYEPVEPVGTLTAQRVSVYSTIELNGHRIEVPSGILPPGDYWIVPKGTSDE